MAGEGAAGVVRISDQMEQSRQLLEPSPCLVKIFGLSGKRMSGCLLCLSCFDKRMDFTDIFLGIVNRLVVSCCDHHV